MEMQLKLAANVGYLTGVQPSRCKSRFFQVYTMTAGIFSLPKLADGFRHLIQPLTIRQQCDEFDGAAQWPQFARSDENGDILLHAVQQLRHLDSQQPGRQILRRPGSSSPPVSVRQSYVIMKCTL